MQYTIIQHYYLQLLINTTFEDEQAMAVKRYEYTTVKMHFQSFLKQ